MHRSTEMVFQLVWLSIGTIKSGIIVSGPFVNEELQAEQQVYIVLPGFEQTFHFRGKYFLIDCLLSNMNEIQIPIPNVQKKTQKNPYFCAN